MLVIPKDLGYISASHRQMLAAKPTALYPLAVVDSNHELRHKAVTFGILTRSFPDSFKGGSVKRTARFIFSWALAIAVAVGASTVARALEVGDKAPDFELESSQGGKLKLSSLRGKNVLINFYVLDFSPT